MHHKKPNGPQEIEKHFTRQTKKTPKMASRSGLGVENFFSAVSIGVIQKTFLQTFMKRV